jgi:uncharacterized protein (TIGR02391 family)
MPLPARIMAPVTIVKRTVDGGEQRVQVHGSVQSRKAMFNLGVDIDEGDDIEQQVAPDKIRTYRATHVTYHQQPAHMAHVVVEIEPVTLKAPVIARKVDIPNMHPAVSAAAGALFADQHYSRAVFAAFQAVEHRVQQGISSSESGVRLMHRAFDPANAIIDVARHAGRNAVDEREGFRFLFVGAMQAIRNPRGHGEDLPDSAEEALEYLALASLFMRRLDHAGVA